MAVNHLVNLGHKNIAFLNGSLYSLVSDQRQEAFESAMAAASLPVQKDLTATMYPTVPNIMFPDFLPPVPLPWSAAMT